MALRAILDDAQPVSTGEFADRGEIDRLAIEMHRQHDGRTARRRASQGRLQRRRIHAKAAGLDIDEHRRSAGMLDRGDRRHGGVRHGKNEIARRDAAGAQGKLDRVGAAGATDAVRDAEKAGKSALETFDLAPEDVLAAVEHSRDRGVDLGFLRPVAGARIGLRNWRCAHHYSQR